MNKLTSRLLFTCFEHGPFEHEVLVRACLTWSCLARAWLAQTDRLMGFQIRNKELMRDDRPGWAYQDFLSMGQFSGESEMGLSWIISKETPHHTFNQWTLTLYLCDREGVTSAFQFRLVPNEPQHEIPLSGLTQA